MQPLVALTVLFAAFTILGRLAIPLSFGWHTALRLSLGGIFLLTASAHWGRRRPDLIRMVPPALPRPDLLVTLTGVCEILGAIGLMMPSVAPYSALALSLSLLARFPANVQAAPRAPCHRGTAGHPPGPARGDPGRVCLCHLVRLLPGSGTHSLTQANKCFIHMFETMKRSPRMTLALLLLLAAGAGGHHFAPGGPP